MKDIEKIEYEIVNLMHTFDLSVTGYLNGVLEDYKLSSQQYYILEIVYKLELVSQDMVVHYMAVNKSNVTKLLNSLEELELIEKRPSIVDKRVRMIAMTKEGIRMIEEINTITSKFYEEIFSSLSEYQKLSMVNMLQILKGKIHKKL